jgi:uncharacterized protein YdiU (UPF0061 family)
MLVGFIHGVMNTDNMTISGESIDFGPCAFMDAYDPATVFSSIDEGGRYAYGNQPRIAQWNLARLAETLLPTFADDTDAHRGGHRCWSFPTGPRPWRPGSRMPACSVVDGDQQPLTTCSNDAAQRRLHVIVQDVRSSGEMEPWIAGR